MSNAFAMIVVLEDGERHEIRTNLKDQLRYEEAARKGKWGTLTENLLRYEAFTAWAAMTRLGLTDAKWDDFGDSIEQIDSEVISPSPTRPAPSSEPTSS